MRGNGREASPGSIKGYNCLRAFVRGSDKTDCGANEDVVQLKFAVQDKIDFVFVRQISHE